MGKGEEEGCGKRNGVVHDDERMKLLRVIVVKEKSKDFQKRRRGWKY